tara:strand:- start:1057 stop:1242 length:186 start_codon:yes stop_codon:yes gene_type:complete
MQKILTKEDLTKLRNDGTITATEIAEIVGDLLLVTNVETNVKRVVESHPILTEGNRRILKG